jgi:hypothetical protein
VKLVDVPRVHSREFLPPRYGGEPRVVIDNVQNWRALDLWQPDYLRSVAGDHYVSVRETIGPPRNVYQNLAQGGKISFSEYLDWVLETADSKDLKDIVERGSNISEISRAVSKSDFKYAYYLDVKLEELSEVLFKDVEVPNWYRAKPLDVIFWCGVLGTSCGLHSDITPNCNVQIKGRKHFILFSPTQASLLDQIPGRTHCRFDPNIPDFDRFPFARDASGMQCTLHSGESLYIPVGWFHQVTVTSGWALNVNFFWPRPFPQGLTTPPLWRLLVQRGWAWLMIVLTRNIRRL